MPIFNEEKQLKKIETLRKQEEEELARILAKKYGLEYADLSQESINTDALRLLPEKQARDAEVAAFQQVGKRVSLAVRTPNNPRIPEITEDLERRGYQLAVFMVSKPSLDRAWDHYKDLSFAVETQAGILDISGEEIERLLSAISNLDDARKKIVEVLQMKRAYRITRSLETVAAAAMSTGASDIHLEPEEDRVRLRFRLDGVLTEILMFDRETYELLLSRIKLLSGLLLNVRHAPQDGRFSVRIDNKDIEIRTSILPGAYGESIVLRLLDPHTIGVAMEELGIEPRLLKILDAEIHKPNGMILTTGPTGSGKTTTLYAFMRRIHTPDIKVLTIEDPVEYHLAGIVQTQVNHKEYTFNSGLRSALRQDPDVIMVGEIRDEEVAATAIHAALTGHLVFSTLHTNNAAGAFPRLIDLGVDPTILGSAVNVAMAQRLVRRLDDKRKKAMPIEGKNKEFVDKVLASITDPTYLPKQRDTMWVPEVTEGETGYRGRIGVYEAILMTKDIENCVRQGGGARDIAEAARSQNILNMHQDAVLKALNGITSLEEIERVIGFDPDSH
jgi:type IV pilus assembly protein PilB